MTDLEPHIASELMDSFNDLYDDVEGILEGLIYEYSKEDLNALFRAIHNIKGNAGICRLEGIVDFTHVIEEVAESLRSDRFEPTPLVCEAIQLGMDRLKEIHLRELKGKHFDNIREDELKVHFHAIATADQHEVNDKIKELLVFLGVGDAFTPEDVETAVAYHVNSGEKVVADHEVGKEAGDRQEDLLFFKEIAHQLDRRNRHWVGRSGQLYEWAHKLNKIAGNFIDYEQLTAAVYLHDIGFSFLPTDLLNKKERLSTDEILQMREHPTWGARFLSRMSGWEEASEIILHHHEHVDGAGFPQGLKQDSIHTGARLLAVIDAFFTQVNGRADRIHRRSVMRAVSSINARVDAQFDGMWVQCFNYMVRKELQDGSL